jgi:hypothetical protein
MPGPDPDEGTSPDPDLGPNVKPPNYPSGLPDPDLSDLIRTWVDLWTRLWTRTQKIRALTRRNASGPLLLPP